MPNPVPTNPLAPTKPDPVASQTTGEFTAANPAAAEARAKVLRLVRSLCDATAEWVSHDPHRADCLRRFHHRQQPEMSVEELLLVGEYHRHLRDRFLKRPDTFGASEALLHFLLTTPPFSAAIAYTPPCGGRTRRPGRHPVTASW